MAEKPKLKVVAQAVHDVDIYLLSEGDPTKDPMVPYLLAGLNMGLYPARPFGVHSKWLDWEPPAEPDNPKILAAIAALPRRPYVHGIP